MTQIRSEILINYYTQILKPQSRENLFGTIIFIIKIADTYIVLCPRHCSKLYININSFNPPNNHGRQKYSHFTDEGAEGLAGWILCPNHTINKDHFYEENSGSLVPKSVLLTTTQNRCWYIFMAKHLAYSFKLRLTFDLHPFEMWVQFCQVLQNSFRKNG